MFGRVQYEADFFGGKKSHYLVAKELNMDSKDVLDHMMYHSQQGKQLVLKKKELDSQFESRIKAIQDEFLDKSVAEVKNRYENLTGITIALEKVFWELYSNKGVLDKDELQRLIVTIEAIRRNVDTLLKF